MSSQLPQLLPETSQAILRECRLIRHEFTERNHRAVVRSGVPMPGSSMSDEEALSYARKNFPTGIFA